LALSLRARDGGTLLEVRAAPKSSRDALRGEVAGRLKVAVTAAPERGRANAALARTLAKALGVARGAVELVSGETSRDKTFLVAGIAPEEVRRRLG